MVKISEIIKTELGKLSILKEVEDLRLINISALAEDIHRKLENDYKMKTTFSGVSMAIRRILAATSFAGNKKDKKYIFPKQINIDTKTGLFEVAVNKTNNALLKIRELKKKLDVDSKSNLSIFEGSYEISIFISSSYKRDLLNELKSLTITSKADKLAYLSVNWPKETKKISGIYSIITKELALKEIPIHSMHSIGSEMMLIVENKYLLGVHTIISDLFK